MPADKPIPTEADRRQLDRIIPEMVKLLNGVELERFRPSEVQKIPLIDKKINSLVLSISAIFVILFLCSTVGLVTITSPALRGIFGISIWCGVVGGLGAISEVMLFYAEPSRVYGPRLSDLVHFYAKLIVAVIFAMLLGPAIGGKAISDYLFQAQNGDAQHSLLVLVPFLVGYSSELAIAMMDKLKAVLLYTLDSPTGRSPQKKVRNPRSS